MGSRDLRQRKGKKTREVKKVRTLDLKAQASGDSPGNLGLRRFSSFQRLALSLQKVSYPHTKDIYTYFLVYHNG